MRVADSTVYSTILRSLDGLAARQLRSQEQLSSGKRISKPSDDPFAFLKSLTMKNEQSAGQQYSKNIEETISWLQTTSDALTVATSSLQRVGELATEGGDGTKSQGELDAIASEVEQILRHLIDVGNTKHLSRSIFAGNQTLTPAFTVAGYDANGNVATINYNGDVGVRNIEVGAGQLVAVNELGEAPSGAVFRNTAAGVDIFQTLMDLRDNLLAGNISAVMNTDIANVESCLSSTLSFQTRIGAKQNRLESNASALGDREADLVKLISDNEDLDYAEAVMEYSEAQTTYEAALAAGARIMETTLLDFLR